jgi:flavin reductase (DIM6/NTAB) family NADH-FMN oxidoreductase RutF
MHRPEGAGADSTELRSCLARFLTGVSVVTFAAPDGPRGITVNSFTAVSVAPPLILISLAKGTRTHGAFRGRCWFCVNVLGSEHETVARHFAGASAPEPPTLAWRHDAAVPRLADALAHFECEPWRDYEGGDHTLFLGRIVDYAFRDGDALGFFAGSFLTVGDTRLGHEHLL